MESRSEMHVQQNGARVEVGTVIYEGREFAALGSVVDESQGVIVGYPKDGYLETWDGQTIEGLKLYVVSYWRTPQSYLSSYRYAYQATYKGKTYHGRGAGDGMLLTLRVSRAKRRN